MLKEGRGENFAHEEVGLPESILRQLVRSRLLLFWRCSTRTALWSRSTQWKPTSRSPGNSLSDLRTLR